MKLWDGLGDIHTGPRGATIRLGSLANSGELGIEPRTLRLTVARSAAELHPNKMVLGTGIEPVILSCKGRVITVSPTESGGMHGIQTRCRPVDNRMLVSHKLAPQISYGQDPTSRGELVPVLEGIAAQPHKMVGHHRIELCQIRPKRIVLP